MMCELIRMIRYHLFGTRFVTLFDHDGEITVAKVKFRGGVCVADRIPFGIRTVELLDDGLIRNGGYVMGWRPYKPSFSRKNYPKGIL